MKTRITGTCHSLATWRVGLTAMLATALAPLSLHAQSIDAPRYINPQGVEVIQGRRMARPAPGAEVSTAPGEAPAQATGARPNPNSNPNPRTADTGPVKQAVFQIAAGEQTARDRDRLAILNQEMRAESTALESKIRILQNPAMRAKLDPEQLKRLQETTLEHEKNIRSLTAEINRAKKSM